MPRMDHIGLKPCGCVGIWIAGELADLEPIRLSIAIRQAKNLGLRVEEEKREVVRAMSFFCRECNPLKMLGVA
jgi:hypothetical protein